MAAAGVAATVVGLAAGLLRRGRGRGGVPPLVVTLAGITPLLPGLTAYRGFYQLAVEGVADGLVTVTLALASGSRWPRASRSGTSSPGPGDAALGDRTGARGRSATRRPHGRDGPA